MPELQIDIPAIFSLFRRRIYEESKYIVRLFPEYTPHDEERHLQHLFFLADKLLGPDLYAALNPIELTLLSFALYCHDWGMAVSDDERRAVIAGDRSAPFPEAGRQATLWTDFFASESRLGRTEDDCWPDFVRMTHGWRSAARARQALREHGDVFAESVAKLAEGHSLSLKAIRDTSAYPLARSVLGQTINLAAVASYVRMIDLLDIGDDRTPYALWRFVAPKDAVSAIEWAKHRALSPVSVTSSDGLRKVAVSAVCDNPEIYAVVQDLRTSVMEQFSENISFIQSFQARYRPPLDSQIDWEIAAIGFEPILMRFTFDRAATFAILSRQIYENQPYAFLRELLQNSVDAIDTRRAVLRSQGADLEGLITVTITPSDTSITISWTDNGIGMDLTTLRDYFATLGKSWYRGEEYLRRDIRQSPIARFGIGIISCFGVSDSMHITTRREPLLAEPNTVGYSVHIRDKLSVFSVAATDRAPVGTTINLRIDKKQIPGFSDLAIMTALRQYAGFCEYPLSVSSRGHKEEIHSLSEHSPLDSLPIIVPVTYFADIADVLNEHTERLVLKIEDESARYEAIYAALLPVKPTEVRYVINSGYKWPDTQVIIDPSVFHNQGRNSTTYVKGIAAEESRHRTTEWFSPVLLLNVRIPDMAQPNLARNQIALSEEVLTAVWNKVAAAAGPRLGLTGSLTVQARAVLLGAAHHFGGIPIASLRSVVPAREWPVLVLRSGEGLAWVQYSELDTTELFEVPHELLYLSGDAFDQGRIQECLKQWKGPTAVVTASDRGSKASIPGISAIIGSCRELIEADGFYAGRIEAFTSTEGEPPLVSRIWIGTQAGRPPEELDTEALSAVGADFPKLVAFPQGLHEYAAFGSLYWNVNNLKIQDISTLLLNLAKKAADLPFDARAEFNAYRSPPGFVGYVIPSRVSGSSMAVGRIQKLIDIARTAGLGEVEGIFNSEFVPGTLLSYKNPYHYDFSRWKNQSVGTPYSTSS